jgi:hypothetical protein
VKKNEFLHLSDKLDILDERLDVVERILAVQEQNLQLHMKRSDALEAQVEPLNKFMWASYGIISFMLFLGAVAGITAFIK